MPFYQRFLMTAGASSVDLMAWFHPQLAFELQASGSWFATRSQSPGEGIAGPISIMRMQFSDSWISFKLLI